MMSNLADPMNSLNINKQNSLNLTNINANRSLMSGGGGAVFSGTDKKLDQQHYLNRPELHMTANTVTQQMVRGPLAKGSFI